jgi:hypothetical protein
MASKMTPKSAAGANSYPRVDKDRGAIATPQWASTVMIEISAMEHKTSHIVGRSPTFAHEPARSK